MAGVWTVSSGCDHASRAQARAVPGTRRSATQRHRRGHGRRARGVWLYVGVDIAAETFTAAWLVPDGKPDAPLTGEQTVAGFAALARHLQSTTIPPAATLAALEATGTSCVALAVALHELGYHVAEINLGLPRLRLFR